MYSFSSYLFPGQRRFRLATDTDRDRLRRCGSVSALESVVIHRSASVFEEQTCKCPCCKISHTFYAFLTSSPRWKRRNFLRNQSKEVTFLTSYMFNQKKKKFLTLCSSISIVYMGFSVKKTWVSNKTNKCSIFLRLASTWRTPTKNAWSGLSSPRFIPLTRTLIVSRSTKITKTSLIFQVGDQDFLCDMRELGF